MLAGEGRTVITTIHQPRSSIVQLFDQLLLLSEVRDGWGGGGAPCWGLEARSSAAVTAPAHPGSSSPPHACLLPCPSCRAG